MKARPRLLVFAALIGAFIAYLYWPAPPPRVAPPMLDDCVQFQVWSNGFHTDLALPAEVLGADHPIRRLYPDARSFMIGWGEEAFYRSDGRDIWAGLDALVPPSASTMHVVAGDRNVRDYFIPKITADVAVSREGAAALAAFIAQALEIGPDGRPVMIVEGKLPGRSAFLRARENFHAFNVCNHWMARALRAAGLDVNARTAWLSDPLTEAARKRGGACPT